MDHDEFRRTVTDLYAIVRKLEAMFEGRPFTPDGHLLGSLGECLVADAYDLQLLRPSNRGHDALTRDGREVEIKATQGRSVAFRSQPQHCIVIRIHRDGTFGEIYNGPGRLIWKLVEGKPLPRNGQYQVALSALQKLQARVDDADRLPRKNA